MQRVDLVGMVLKTGFHVGYFKLLNLMLRDLFLPIFSIYIYDA